jgi:hypothetical protein
MVNRRCACGNDFVKENLGVVGMQRDHLDRPSLVLINCVCRSTRAERWWNLPYSLVRKAIHADLKRMRGAGL